jgi:hypothetical protein
MTANTKRGILTSPSKVWASKIPDHDPECGKELDTEALIAIQTIEAVILPSSVPSEPPVLASLPIVAKKQSSFFDSSLPAPF